MNRVAIMGALLALCACKTKPVEDKHVSGSNAAGNAGSAVATAAPPIDAAVAVAAPSGPFVLPATAQTIPEPKARTADATALGSNVSVQLAEKLGDENDGYREVDEMLVLTGASSVIVEIAYDSDAASAHAGSAAGSLGTVAPLSPPRPFGSDDAKVAKHPLPFKGPLLFFREGKGGELAVAHVDDTIVAWRLMIMHGEGEEGTVQDWFEQAKIKLAPGATVTAR